MRVCLRVCLVCVKSGMFLQGEQLRCWFLSVTAGGNGDDGQDLDSQVHTRNFAELLDLTVPKVPSDS